MGSNCNSKDNSTKWPWLSTTGIPLKDNEQLRPSNSQWKARDGSHRASLTAYKETHLLSREGGMNPSLRHESELLNLKDS